MSDINKIIIHCAATPNGKQLGRAGVQTAAEVIDRWHARNGWRRRYDAIKRFNPHLTSIGYHYVIDVDGAVTTGRAVGEVGAHTKGYNTRSVGICLVGTDKFTRAQWEKLKYVLIGLEHDHSASIHGHREFAAKVCPGFDVQAWLRSARLIPAAHLYGN